MNFKNLCKSLATKYQKDICAVIISIDVYHSLSSLVQVEGPAKLLMENKLKTLYKRYSLPPSTFVYSLSWKTLYVMKPDLDCN